MNTTVEQQELTVADRCDACGAQAYVRVTLSSGNDLLFCGHHARENRDELQPIARDWYDQTSTLS